MTTRREAAAVKWAEAERVSLAKWSAALGLPYDARSEQDDAAREDYLAAAAASRDALVDHEATLVEPAPALDPLTAATVAKLRAAADALERGDVPASLTYQVRGAGAECDAETLAHAAAYADTVLDELRDEARGVEWSDEVDDLRVEAVLVLAAARFVDRRCAAGGDFNETWDYALVDPDAWTEPALDMCDEVGCPQCGGPLEAP